MLLNLKGEPRVMAVQAIAPKPVAPATVPAASSKSSKRGAEEEEIVPVMQVSNKKMRMEDERLQR